VGGFFFYSFFLLFFSFFFFDCPILAFFYVCAARLNLPDWLVYFRSLKVFAPFVGCIFSSFIFGPHPSVLRTRQFLLKPLYTQLSASWLRTLRALDVPCGCSAYFQAIRSSVGAATPTGGHPAWEVAFAEDSGPNFRGHRQALLPDTTRRRASPPPLAAALARKTLLALWPSVFQLTTVLKRAHPNGGTVAYTKTSVPVAGPGWAQSNAVSAPNYAGGQRPKTSANTQ